MSYTQRKSSPAAHLAWWVMTACTGGLWALFVGKPI